MNDKYHKQSFALRAIYEERACPPDNVLRQQSEEMRSHLGYCRYCNERLETADSDSKEWQELVQHMRPALVSENDNKEIVAPGQIWSLDSSHFGGWGPYDRFYTPPLVVVLEIRDQGKTARVAQLCGYTDLMGDDGVDVLLENAGFAESWNVYSVPRQYLKQCRGNVGLISVEKILLKSRYQPQQAETSQIIQQFRELEIQVGAFIAMQALPQVMEAVELVEAFEAAHQPATVASWLESMFGTIVEVAKGLRNYDLDGIPNSIEDWFFSAINPVPQLGAATVKREKPLFVNIVRKQLDGNIDINTMTASISGDWQAGTYFIEGTLDEEFPAGLHLLAWLTYNDERIGECINQMAENSPYFEIVFRNVPEEACRLDNVKFLLVSP